MQRSLAQRLPVYDYYACCSDVTLRMLIDDRYCGRIIGREGKTVKKIREDTGTRISISKYDTIHYTPGDQSINFYLLKMSRDTHKRLFNCEQDNKAETSTNSCPTNKLYYERKGKTQRVQNSLRWRAHTLYQVFF